MGGEPENTGKPKSGGGGGGWGGGEKAGVTQLYPVQREKPIVSTDH